MQLLNIFKQSIVLPKKEALFVLNRVSMRDTLTYIITLMFLLFIPEVVLMLVNLEANQSNLSTYILQLIVFYPFFIVFFAISAVSLLAAISLVMKYWLKRKLLYQQLWKMTSFSLTLPLILYTILRYLSVGYLITNLLPLLLLYFLIYKMIVVYPKRRN